MTISILVEENGNSFSGKEYIKIPPDASTDRVRGLNFPQLRG